jgi:hypothetical protein
MKTVLKVIGGIVGAIALAVVIFWVGWLRAPAAEDVCANVGKILEKETGHAMSNDFHADCIKRAQPPEFGQVPWVAQMKCMRDAQTPADLKACDKK